MMEHLPLNNLIRLGRAFQCLEAAFRNKSGHVRFSFIGSAEMTAGLIEAEVEGFERAAGKFKSFAMSVGVQVLEGERAVADVGQQIGASPYHGIDQRGLG